MKLEAVNGNLLNLLKVPPVDEIVNNNGKGGGKEADATTEDDHHDEDGEGGEKDKEVGGKKKNARKKRSLNWEEAERGLLLEVIKPKVDYVENRNVDAKSIKAKRLAWMQITKQFNVLNFRHRSLEQIQVQWRSMKNSAKREHQQKHPKNNPLEGMDMIEFMEEMQKDPTTARGSQTRGASAAMAAVIIKKELLEIDDDTPLAALPISTNTSEDTLQTSTIALPSPPTSAESQNETQQQQATTTPMRNKKKAAAAPSTITQKQQQQTASLSGGGGSSKPKRQRSQNSTNSQSDTAAPSTNVSATNETESANLPIAALAASTPSSLPSTALPPAVDDNKYKKQLFELMKRARLADMDYARREHEQKLRFEQMEQELKLNYYRQHEELKLRQLREEHEARMRHHQTEHDARMRVYTLSVNTNPAIAGSIHSVKNATKDADNIDGKMMDLFN